MKLSKFTDYNLRVLIYLALNDDRLCTIQEIATAYQISENHLMKVIHHLAKHQTILSRRGKGGGIQLSRAPNQINLAQVIRDAEGNGELIKCHSDNKECCIAPICKLPSIFDQALEVFYQHLAQYSLADVLQRPELMAQHFIPVSTHFVN